LEKFAEVHDSKHKINILYAVVMVLVGIALLIEFFILKE
jgi:hypothetical protein